MTTSQGEKQFQRITQLKKSPTFRVLIEIFRKKKKKEKPSNSLETPDNGKVQLTLTDPIR